MPRSPGVAYNNEMGKYAEIKRHERVKRIHNLIRRHRKVTCGTVARELGVDARTVRRDIDYMRDELMCPVVYDRSRRSSLFARFDTGPGMIAPPTTSIPVCQSL